MKRLLIIILLLITPVVSHAQAIDWTQPVQLAANIGSINGKPWANVDQISGKAKANINNVMGAGVAAGASTFCTDATHTAQNPGTAVRLCEDIESTTSCFTGGNTYCRVTWVVWTNPADDTVAAIDGTHSFGINGASSAAEGLRYDTGAASTTLGIFAKIRVDALPVTAGNIRGFLASGTTSAQAVCELKQDGTLSVYTDARTSATNKVTAGNTYYFWHWYNDSSGSDDGIAYCCFSTDTTRPADPSTSAYCAYDAAHNVTTDVDSVIIYNGYSTTFNATTVDDIVVSTSEIGSNP